MRFTPALLRSLLPSVVGAAALVAAIASPAAADPTVRLRDVATLQGTAPVPLIGYGLVVGLNKTGDKRQTVFSAQTLANMLERFGVLVPGEQIKIENVAAVLVTAELPTFTHRGGRVDITASSIGDARSLQGGTLLPTPLRGTDGTIYALAQGPLSLGGFGGGASSVWTMPPAGTRPTVRWFTCTELPPLPPPKPPSDSGPCARA